jgi:hypothetical protein
MEVPWDRDEPLGEAIRLTAARETKRATRRVMNSPRRYVFKSGTISRSVSSPYQAWPDPESVRWLLATG